MNWKETESSNKIMFHVLKLYFLTAGGRHGPITAHARFQWAMELNTKPGSVPIRNLAER